MSNLVAGGIPTTSQDVTPSIVFIGLYGLTAVLSIYRTFQYRGFCLFTYFRLMIFEICRFITFILRIAVAENYSKVLKGNATFDTNLLTAEQILLSIGFVMPTSTLLTLTEAHSNRNRSTADEKKDDLPPHGAGTPGSNVRSTSHWALGATAAQGKGDLINSNTHKFERILSAIVTLVALALCVAYCIRLLSKPNFPRRTSIWIGTTATVFGIRRLQFVVPIYRIFTIAAPPHDAQSTASKLAFWVLQVSIEWIVGASLESVNVIEWCGMDKEELDRVPAVPVSDVESHGLYVPKYY
ncbi:hypothetical protein EVG20_g1401 [Dentipellis fragilis]|uniref:Uncharacterized protein n=1 Tax=Dentipellis fragilis TaxID=205917 RepID=A0A4Y9Z9S2_9AGAM|nr:hypothetical protein EVG20_g1401 [Dentipellis fragilis]